MRIKNITKRHYSGSVYNVNCSPDHIFKLTAGVFTHNCGSGDYFVRSFNADEIAYQPQYLLDQTGINPADIQRLQIMFMSMGEPMHNWKELKQALINLNIMYPNAALLISTSAPKVWGAFDEFTQLSKKITTIGLQFSVHESTDEARRQLIPTETMSLKQIATIGEYWWRVTGRQPFFNYCVHEKNNTQADVDRLYSLFPPEIWNATLSVICERDETIAEANDRQRELAVDFSNKMLDKGYSVRVFSPDGQDDIAGGCGQLWQTQTWMQNNLDKAKKSKGYGLPVIHTPT